MLGAPCVCFIHGILVIPPFLLLQNLWIKAGLIVIYYIILILESRRIKLLPQVIIFITIVLANLFMPQGEVLVKVFDIPLTSGALSFGMEKALNVLGLFLISLFSIRKGFEFPGAFGRILSKTMNFLDFFLEHKGKLPVSGGARSLGKALDRILIKAWKKNAHSTQDEQDRGILPYLIVSSILIIINWLALFITLSTGASVFAA